MIKIKISEKLIRWILGILLLVVAINAFAGGYYGLSGAKNIPTEWLKGSPFRDYFIQVFSLRHSRRYISLCSNHSFSFQPNCTQGRFYLRQHITSLANGAGSNYWICFLDAARHYFSSSYNSFFNLSTSQI